MFSAVICLASVATRWLGGKLIHLVIRKYKLKYLLGRALMVCFLVVMTIKIKRGESRHERWSFCGNHCAKTQWTKEHFSLASTNMDTIRPMVSALIGCARVISRLWMIRDCMIIMLTMLLNGSRRLPKISGRISAVTTLWWQWDPIFSIETLTCGIK